MSFLPHTRKNYIQDRKRKESNVPMRWGDNEIKCLVQMYNDDIILRNNLPHYRTRIAVQNQIIRLKKKGVIK